MKVGWKEISLEDACEMYQPKTITSNDLIENGEFPVYGANGVIGRYNQYNHEHSQLIITCRGATCGAVNVSQPKSWITGNAMVVRPKIDNLSIKFLEYLFRGQINLTKAITGAAQPQITRQSLNPIVIPLPPLAEQHRIVDILDRAASIQRLRTEADAKLRELIPALFVDMFGDPVTNPKGWPVTKFGQLGQLDRGKSRHRPRDAAELYDGPYPFIQTGDVAKSDGYIRSYSTTYSELGLAQSKLWKAGTLCITIAANIAKTGILAFDACFPDSVVGYIPNNEAMAEYIRAWLSFLQPTLEANAPQAAQKNINLEILRDLPVPLPPIELQSRFSDYVSALYSVRQLSENSKASIILANEGLFHELLI